MKKRNEKAVCGNCAYWDNKTWKILNPIERCFELKGERGYCNYFPETKEGGRVATGWCGEHPDFWEAELIGIKSLLAHSLTEWDEDIQKWVIKQNSDDQPPGVKEKD